MLCIKCCISNKCCAKENNKNKKNNSWGGGWGTRGVGLTKFISYVAKVMKWSTVKTRLGKNVERLISQFFLQDKWREDF